MTINWLVLYNFQFELNRCSTMKKKTLTFKTSNDWTYLNSTEFKSFRTKFNLSRCRLRSEAAFSQIFTKLSMDLNKKSFDICGGGFMLIFSTTQKNTNCWFLFDISGSPCDYLTVHTNRMTSFSKQRKTSVAFFLNEKVKFSSILLKKSK